MESGMSISLRFVSITRAESVKNILIRTCGIIFLASVNAAMIYGVYRLFLYASDHNNDYWFWAGLGGFIAAAFYLCFFLFSVCAVIESIRDIATSCTDIAMFHSSDDTVKSGSSLPLNKDIKSGAPSCVDAKLDPLCDKNLMVEVENDAADGLPSAPLNKDIKNSAPSCYDPPSYCDAGRSAPPCYGAVCNESSEPDTFPSTTLEGAGLVGETSVGHCVN